jgi:TrmH family RNA methyltransferase
MLARCHVHLVGTSNPENLGSVARLLENFGVATTLTLTAPRVAPDDHRALVVGRAARARLETARVVPTLAEAVADCAFVVGFSARRGSERPGVSLRALAATLAERAPAGAIALVFGPEDTGLLGEHIHRCDLVASIETPGPLASFNLGQAVALALWELARAEATPVTPARGGASHAELEALLDHAFSALDAVGYFRGQERERKRVHLRRVLAGAGLRSDEVRGLHGLCAQVLKALAAGGGQAPL